MDHTILIITGNRNLAGATLVDALTLADNSPANISNQVLKIFLFIFIISGKLLVTEIGQSPYLCCC